MHDKRGIALIFNHEKFIDPVYSKRKGTKKDGDDLKDVLKKLNFDVRYYMNLKLDEIKQILYEVSLEDHSNNDCLLVSVMSHGDKDDKILAQDEEYFVQELWENFIGDNCVSLIGKPKLFFIEASRGENIDFGVPHNDEVDSIKKEFLIPKLADLLVLKSTAEGHHTFRNPSKGSWFIQALCEELKNNLKEIHLGDDFMQVLTRVNRRVAFDKIANAPNNIEYNNGKQMPNILSFLTKSFVFSKKSIIPVKSVSSDEKKKKNRSKMTDLCYDMSNANRGVALIFSNEYKNTNYGAVNSDTDDFKAVLEILQFDVRIYKNLKVDEIRNILHEESDEMVDLPEKVYVIPKLADLMVMYAAIENHTSYFHLSSEKSWFTEALIAELKTNLQGDFLRMLTKVNERVANKAHLKDSDFYDAKQMPIIVSMLTKELCFTSKTEE
ncbi:unnamed protein product [Diamesa hyperborea]